VAQEIAAVAERAQEEAGEAAAWSAPSYDSERARWWGERFAAEEGAAPGTVFLQHQQVSEQCPGPRQPGGRYSTRVAPSGGQSERFWTTTPRSGFAASTY
jgi:hypothetical protein